MTTKKTGKAAGGRPRKYEYDPGYCDELIRMMGEGFSITAVAGHLGVSRQRLYHWAEDNDELAEAMNVGRAKRTLCLEKDLLSADTGPKATSRIFALKNACPDEWRDKQELDHQGNFAIELVQFSKTDGEEDKNS